MNKELNELNMNEKIKEHLAFATRDIGALVEHFSDPCYNPAQCGVMKRVKANIEAVAALLEE